MQRNGSGGRLFYTPRVLWSLETGTNTEESRKLERAGNSYNTVRRTVHFASRAIYKGPVNTADDSVFGIMRSLLATPTFTRAEQFHWNRFLQWLSAKSSKVWRSLIHLHNVVKGHNLDMFVPLTLSFWHKWHPVFFVCPEIGISIFTFAPCIL